ncbi:uncharacterized protein LOC116189761 [Punica granatum]|uniref:Uncharacterized protein LOC116188073 n=2 Tax=Punica granatum TaxID=22663 RepID=A0A6P8BQP1_PUNGR|nr:uncharacterized protein LOC116188073 [Punica granatum]XP_031373061.1 uncharacterized protein LOC116188073 [Punica granatum]XP_031373062.1 uncharacterized protein LOC116188073 [Punica granatum]XP_031373063.1 uncharacterized protein LOC116188073 [Punica granatum]XP_031373064.1 uncharacterized protein LOC116188073 [Punica granatum]XP_031373065.1 uncharacterized protein LOC116188073 [Punica granatum]XP_031375336.1 uncharacterized protein LOC116189759 [Punica granatum]XP_031375337.1 uncharacte
MEKVIPIWFLLSDALFTVGGTAKMSAAFWYPVNGNPWHGSGHFFFNCDWVSMDISSGKSLLTKTASSGSSWDAAGFVKTVHMLQMVRRDAQFTVGGAAEMFAAFWYPVNGNPWHGSGHFSINYDWVSMDISSGKSLLTKIASLGSLWDAASAFSLLFSVISLCLSVFIAYRIFGPKSAQYMPMEISLG